ncbi:MAG: retropepsin-like aspartic protease [Bacteroidota bacterium]
MARHKINIEILSIQDYGIHCFIPVKVNGVTARLLIDTGASKTVFAKEFIANHLNELYTHKSEQLTTGLGSSNIESEEAVIPLMKIGKLRVKNYHAHILDLSQVNDTYKQVDLPPIDGVIGCDLLLEHKATLNFKKRSLTMSE